MRKSRASCIASRSVLLALGTALATGAYGQAAPAPASPPPATTDTRGLEEIVVTAQRRAENLIRVPLSIQAVTGSTLQNQGITRVEQLQNTVPGLAIQYGQGGTFSPFIRGVGNALSGSYAENSVALYIDDVPRPRLRGATDLPDIERVEVLKGPQGALYGRNATGGAINIVTKDPSTTHFAVDGRFSYGSFSTLEAQGYVNVPLSDTLAFSVAGSHRGRDGTIKNHADNTVNPLRQPNNPSGIPAGGPKHDFDFEQVDSNTFDGKLKWTPSDRFNLTLRADYTHQDDTLGSGWVQRDPAVTAGLLSAVTGMDFTAADLQVGKPARYSYADQSPVHDVKDYGASAKAVMNFDGFSITSISSYRKYRELASIDLDGTAIPIEGFTAYFRSRTFSQEVRAVSDGTGKFNWIVGGTYFNDHPNDEVSGQVGQILITGPVGLTRQQILDGDFPSFSLPSLHALLWARSWAVFGQASYKFTDSLELLLSGRYTEERRRLLFPAQVNTGGLEAEGRSKETAFTPAATLNYKFGNSLVYARYAKGYKSGGLNDLLNPFALGADGNPVGINRFKPEKLDSYEIGYKAELFDRRVRVTAAAYHYDYRNLQFQRVLSAQATSVVLNAQKARINGVELAVDARANEWLTLSGGINYNDAKYKKFLVDDITHFDASGNRMISAPKWSATMSADLAVPMSERLVFAGNADVSWRSGQYFDPENTSFNHQSAFAVVNGRLGVRTSDNRYGAYVFARNLFDKKYATFGQTNSAGVVVNYGDRRIVGGTVEVHF